MARSTCSRSARTASPAAPAPTSTSVPGSSRRHEARVGGRTLIWEADLGGYRFRPAMPGALREELARERRWPVAVKRIETPRILFTREPLREPATLEIATDEHRLRLALDALGNLR